MVIILLNVKMYNIHLKYYYTTVMFFDSIYNVHISIIHILSHLGAEKLKAIEK